MEGNHRVHTACFAGVTVDGFEIYHEIASVHEIYGAPQLQEFLVVAATS